MAKQNLPKTKSLTKNNEETTSEKLDTIISLLEKLINTVSKELAKDKAITAEQLFPHSK